MEAAAGAPASESGRRPSNGPLSEQLQELKERRAALHAQKAAVTKQMKQERKRISKLKKVLAKVSEEDLRQCLSFKVQQGAS